MLCGCAGFTQKINNCKWLQTFANILTVGTMVAAPAVQQGYAQHLINQDPKLHLIGKTPVLEKTVVTPPVVVPVAPVPLGPPH